MRPVFTLLNISVDQWARNGIISFMTEELPPENKPLPRMIDLYREDLRYCTRLTEEEICSYLSTFDPERRQAFIESWLWLPLSIAYSLCQRNYALWPCLMDFIEEGNIGLMHAVKYAPEYEGGFESTLHFRRYASQFIRGLIYNYFSRIPTVYVPPMSRRRRESQDEDPLELFDLLHSTYLNAACMNIIAPDDLLSARENEQQREKIETLFLLLTSKERRVLRLRYGLDGEPHTYREIGKMLNRSEGGIFLIHDQAIQRLSGKRTSLPRELYPSDREQRMLDLLKTWREQGVKITIMGFVKEIRCSTEAASAFLHKHNAIKRRG